MSPYTLPPNPVWFITGCSSGIGLGLATYLSTLTHSTTSTPRIAATARSLSSLSTLPSAPNILKLELDVTSDSSVAAALATTVAHFGRIDVVVNNAGFNVLAEAEMVSMDAARDIMETNFWGAVRVTRAVLPILRDSNANGSAVGKDGVKGVEGEGRGGVILQVTSLGGRFAFAGNSFYHASKFALEGFTEALAKELMPDWNIHLCCVEPGGVKTNYAHRAVESVEARAAVERAKGTAYAEENTPTNLLRRYHENPAAMEGWADAEAVAEAVVRLVRAGDGTEGKIPLRMPLGADSWGLQRRGLQVAVERLEAAREGAVRVSGSKAEAQLKSIEFLEF
ncbi:retinol dehydrogenase 8 [Dendryphion nanum]|uniref:Retinol dehydrogenase 8 n=1 Tax=Dendryphion nanum TaxID=256645 RepID=A0A9P9CXU9_9PLEO|nr:retinol dehydrogenase 8 [Dendryphion nanum]